jgi:endo-1,3(4)-beta-glucanase
MRGAGTGLAVAMCVALTACTGGSPTPSPDGPTPPAPSAFPAPEVTVPEQSLGTDVAMRLADGVTPPTNRWYSSLAFGETGLPVFPKPLSFAPVEGGFARGLTRPIASEAAIIGGARADLTVAVSGATGFGTVTRADPVGVSLAIGDASVSLAQGWPVVGITADAALTLTLGSPLAVAGEGLWTVTAGDTEYGVLVDGGLAEGATIDLDEGGNAQIFAVPNGGSAEGFAAALGSPVGEVAWSGSVADEVATTALDYGTDTVVTMPAARAADAELDCSLGSYLTIDGEFAVCAASEVSWSVPALAPSSDISLEAASDAEREAIAAALAHDVASLAAPGTDSYFGGKHLASMANLLTVAEQVGDDDSAATLTTALTEALKQWGDADRCTTNEPRCFVYDPRIRGIVGVTPAFGSEEFNDHHFHYGYLLYSAAVAAARDPQLAEEIGPVFDQVAADIASATDSGTFPAIRSFDPVAGHSWASGFAPFGDANNQESSSEAVAAWNGLALWAAVRDNPGLEQQATWMLSAEADAARRLWLAPDLSAFPEFGHEIVAIEWGGKRDYATWFSAEPSAMLGIQLIPMAPNAADYLSLVDPERAEATLNEAAPHGFEVMFGDYLLMYAAASGVLSPEDAWAEALALPAAKIDDGNSRAYMLAWLAALPD